MQSDVMAAEAPDLRATPRLSFIEGARGLAALVVCVGHFLYQVPTWAPVSTLAEANPLQILLWPFQFGYEMVCLFLLLSGFSLHYSERARELSVGNRSTLRAFLRRRAWRIAPAYYASLVFGVLVIVALPAPELRPGYETQAQASPAAVLAHLPFLHNAKGEWLLQGNAPLWSLAYEVQLYLLFPMLYALLRRWPPLLIAGTALLAIELGERLIAASSLLGLARWFLAGAVLAELFGRGMRVPRVAAVAGAALVCVGLLRLGPTESGLTHDAVWLGGYSLLLLWMSAHPTARGNPLNGGLFRWVGLRSYSLYVVHFPVVLIALLIVQSAGLTGASAALVGAAAGVPIAVALAWASFAVIERPSLARAHAVH